MAFNIQNIITDISKSGIAKQSHFQIEVTLPRVLGGGLNRKLSFRAERSSLPGRAIMSVDNHRGIPGPIQKIPYAPIYQSIDVTFLCNEKLEEKELFEKWMDAITGTHRVNSEDPENSSKVYNIGYYDDIKGTIDIRQFNETGLMVYHVKCLESYPLQITPLSLSWDSDELHRLDVSFAYRYYQLGKVYTQTKQESQARRQQESVQVPL